METNVVELEPAEKTPSGWHKYWTKEMTAARKRLREFTRLGNEVNAIYLDEGPGKTYADIPSRLNLFYTNVSTMQAMLYGNTPRIEVTREHADPDDDVARVAAVLYQRLLDADTLSTALQSALQDRLVPGLGVCRVRYTVEGGDEVTNESAPVDYVHWQDFTWGWARTWDEVPWLAFRSWLPKDEVTERFSQKIADNLEYKNQTPGGSDEDAYDTEQESNVQKAEIWEIWSIAEKQVFWWSEGADLILDVKDDPLGLEKFWPMPRPMAANLTTTLYTPKADYLMSQDLYREIDVLYARIVTITRSVKVVGVYDESCTDSVGRMLKEGHENELIPVSNYAMFGEKGGLAGVIDWFPIQEVVQTLTTLRQLLGETIELLNQTTGMSDLMRGANTDQYTSDGTNQLTAKFGSIRVQALQDEFARFASDLEGLKAQVIGKHYSQKSIIVQSNAGFIPAADHDKIVPAIELMQSEEVRWRVNIRPESLAMIDYAQLKQERTEFLNAMATYIQSAQAMMKSVPESLPILLEMLKWGMAGFKGSDYLEGTMDQAIEMAKKAPPKDEDGGKGKEQAQLVQMQIQGEMQKLQAKQQGDMQMIQAKSQAEMQKQQFDHQTKMAEQQQKADADQQKILTDLQADLKVIAAKLNSDMQVERAQSTYAMAEEDMRHNNSIDQTALDHTATMAQIEESSESDDD